MSPTKFTKPNAAVFLDRDGVIIHNRANYVRSWSDVKIYPYSLASIKRLSQKYLVFIITNQSPIGRGLLEEKIVLEINEKLQKIIHESGGKVEKIYYCPHTPGTNCSCRKPQPGLINLAVRDFNIDLAKSWMIGDAISDIQAGLNAGIFNNILLQTGRGKKQLLKKPTSLKLFVQKNLKTAVDFILYR